MYLCMYARSFVCLFCVFAHVPVRFIVHRLIHHMYRRYSINLFTNRLKMLVISDVDLGK